MPRHDVKELQELRPALPTSVRYNRSSKDSCMTFRHLLIFIQEFLLTFHSAPTRGLKTLTTHLLFLLSVGKSCHFCNLDQCICSLISLVVLVLGEGREL
jgi:hypothetical protein